MEPINDGGPAFPEAGLSGLPNGEFIHGRPGMSQRALFAAILMHAELATSGLPGEACEALINAAEESGREVEDQMAFNAVQCADALIRALAEPQQPRLTYAEQLQLVEHEKMLAILKDISESGSIRYLTHAQRDQIVHVLPRPVDEDEIPF